MYAAAEAGQVYTRDGQYWKFALTIIIVKRIIMIITIIATALRAACPSNVILSTWSNEEIVSKVKSYPLWPAS